VKRRALPKTLGGLVDRLFDVRQERYRLQHEAEALREQERDVEEALKSNLTKKDLAGVVGRRASCELKRKQVVRIVDFERLARWCSRRRAWDLLQRRVNDRAVKDRLEAGKRVDGVELVPLFRISLSKRED
jgi:hypothetical protein